MKRLSAILLALCLLQPAMAADEPASDASIRELMSLTKSRDLVDRMLGQVDTLMESSMQQAIGDQQLSPDQQRVMHDMQTRMMALLKDELKWETMEPMLIDIYRSSFTQQEIDGMLAFYKSDAGRAVIAKMPVVMQNTMHMMQRRMANLTTKLQQLQKETIAQLKTSNKKSSPAK